MKPDPLVMLTRGKVSEDGSGGFGMATHLLGGGEGGIPPIIVTYLGSGLQFQPAFEVNRFGMKFNSRTLRVSKNII